MIYNTYINNQNLCIDVIETPLRQYPGGMYNISYADTNPDTRADQ